MGRVYVLSKEEGGRHTPFFSGYRPQFYFRTTDVTARSNFPRALRWLWPGDHIDMTIQLITSIAIEPGLRFAIREAAARLPPASSPKSSRKREKHKREALQRVSHFLSYLF